MLGLGQSYDLECLMLLVGVWAILFWRQQRFSIWSLLVLTTLVGGWLSFFMIRRQPGIF